MEHDLNRTLSKSKLMAYRQCERRLWLEVHRPDLRQDSTGSQARFDAGHQVGDLARTLYDEEAHGVLIDPRAEGYAAALARTTASLQSRIPVFEAGFSANGGMAFADVMVPAGTADEPSWRMVEVKSSTNVKDYHRDDVAVQAYVARSAGVNLTSIAVACVDSRWVYPGEGRYAGMLKEVDLSAEAFARTDEVVGWIAQAQATVNLPKEPSRSPSDHCNSPFACGFIDHCATGTEPADFPVAWIPRATSKALKNCLADPAVRDLRDVPDELLNPLQLRVKTQSLLGEAWFDRKGAAESLSKHQAPLYFLDFETIQFVVPVWAGTSPYQQLSFQFSRHCLREDGTLDHAEFLDLSGRDPSEAFAKAVSVSCDTSGPVFVYNAGFERARLNELAARFPEHRPKLKKLAARLVDLHPVAKKYYYDPSQQGSWSIKKVLPAVVPELRYSALDGVQDGGAAMEAFMEATSVDTSVARKEELRTQLLAYCRLDTYAMVRLWQVFANRPELVL